MFARGGSLAAPLIIQQKNSEDERSGPIRGQPASARPRRGHRALIKAARFANRRNSYCGTMACLDNAKIGKLIDSEGFSLFPRERQKITHFLRAAGNAIRPPVTPLVT